MGCDIHMHFEYQSPWDKSIPRKWVDGNFYRKSLYVDDIDSEEYSIVSIYPHRNYSLFAVLADVRNSEGIIPISQPRGLPEDANSFIIKDSNSWGCDGHSHSYFTLRELVDFQNKNLPIKYAGYVTLEDSEIIDEGGMPSSWCKDYWPKDNKHVWKEWQRPDTPLEFLINKIKERMEYFIYSNKEEYYDMVRIVFWFDN